MNNNETRTTSHERRETSDDYRLIPLTRGQFAIVDAEDYERLSQYKWCLGGKKGQYYAQRRDHGRMVFMHREILEVPAGMVCDHINHNILDNRKCNLRVCTPAQNQYNRLPSERGTSRYKGVCWHKVSRKWTAEIGFNKRRIHIGYYDYEQDAAIAYDDMAIHLFGEFACLNCSYRPEIRQWMQDCYLFPPHEIGHSSRRRPLPEQERPPSHEVEPEFLKEAVEQPEKSHILLHRQQESGILNIRKERQQCES